MPMSVGAYLSTIILSTRKELKQFIIISVYNSTDDFYALWNRVSEYVNTLCYNSEPKSRIIQLLSIYSNVLHYYAVKLFWLVTIKDEVCVCICVMKSHSFLYTKKFLPRKVTSLDGLVWFFCRLISIIIYINIHCMVHNDIWLRARRFYRTGQHSTTTVANTCGLLKVFCTLINI